MPAPRRGTALADLRAVVERAQVRGDALIHDVTHDSREAADGVLFACRPGAHVDGHEFAAEAVAAGAAALLVERWLPHEVPQLRVPSVAASLGPLSAAVHGHPSRQLLTFGVTGTNGKTTTAYLLEAALAAAGHQTGLVGTVETRSRGRVVAGVRTTPEATDLQRLLRSMADDGVTATVMEVSSHGLALGRVRGMRFAVAVFTNLSQDHLDFHADMEEYFAAKAELFRPAYCPLGVVNVDDPYGRRLAEQTDIEVVRVSPAGHPGADVRATDTVADPGGTRFTAHLRSGRLAVRSRLVGDFNVANVLCALATAEAAGVDVDAAGQGIAAVPGVPGRMESIDAGQGFTVLVDYAHTPDSVTSVLETARRLTEGRLIVVLGCGGDRDRGKRPLMGRAAVKGADLAILTSDNPRHEQPEAILDAVAAGAADAGGRYQVVVDRREAIATALAAADEDAVVVIAGKGHEATQEVAGEHRPFDDREVARDLLAGARR